MIGYQVYPLVGRRIELRDDALLPFRAYESQQDFRFVDRILTNRPMSACDRCRRNHLTIVRDAKAMICIMRQKQLK